MSLQESLREQLIKQFDADVSIIKDEAGVIHYACPSCQRYVAISNKKCSVCDQTLNWEHVRNHEMELQGKRIATISFEVPADFTKSYCRKCPISYIAKQDSDKVYECPLGLRNNCPIEIK